MASLSSLAWLASWADFKEFWFSLTIASSDLASHSLEKALVPPFFLPTPLGILFGIRKMSKIWLMVSLSLLTFGQMVVGNLSLILMLRLRGLERLFTLQLSSLTVIIGAMPRILMIRRRVALTSSRVSLAQFSRSKGLSIGVLFLLCKPILVFIFVSTI